MPGSITRPAAEVRTPAVIAIATTVQDAGSDSEEEDRCKRLRAGV
jgi:hypothetical protein